MKLKNFTFVAALMSALIFSSCSNDENQIPDVTSTSESKATFNISIPVADPETYAENIQAGSEIAINSLYIIKFDEDGNMVDNPTSIYSNLNGKSPNFSYTTNFKSDTLDANKAVYRFLFVANLDLSNLNSGINTIEDFNSYMLSKTLVDNESCNNLVTTPSDSTSYTIPMTGIGYQNGNPFVTLAGGSEINVEVNLTRVVARIDIVNNMELLNITDLKLLNTFDKSYLLSAANCEELNDNKTYTKTPLNANKVTALPFTTIPTTGLGLKTGMPKAFYLYEESQNSNRCCAIPELLTLEVTVNYAGKVSTFDIPFVDNNNKGIEIKRNYLYKVTLGTADNPNGSTDKIGFSITCDNWKFKFAKVLINGTTDEITVE